MRYIEISKKLNLLGCQELKRRGRGSHRRWHNPKNGQIAVIPDWGKKELKIGTLKAVLKQLGISWEEFTKTK